MRPLNFFRIPLCSLILQFITLWICICRPKFSIKRRLRIRTLQYGAARNINELYDSVDPEVVLSILVHKVCYNVPSCLTVYLYQVYSCAIFGPVIFKTWYDIGHSSFSGARSSRGEDTAT